MPKIALELHFSKSLRSTKVLLAERNPEDDVSNKGNVNSFDEGNEFDANSENNVVKLLENSLLMIDDGLVDKSTDEITTNETFLAYNIDCFENTTCENFNDSTDSELPILWINATYQAYDKGLNVTTMVECATRNASSAQINATDDDTSWTTGGVEIISTKDRLEELKLNADLLSQYREELYPSKEKLQQFEEHLKEIIRNITFSGLSTKLDKSISTGTVTPITPSISGSMEREFHKLSLARYRRDASMEGRGDDESDEFPDLMSGGDKDGLVGPFLHFYESSWNSNQEESQEINKEMISNDNDDKSLKASLVIKVDGDQQQARLIVNNWDVSQALRLNIPKRVFERHQLVGLLLNGICADFVPSAVDEFNATEFEGVDIEGPIGLNITALSLSGVNLTELAEKLRNDTEVDMILSRTMSEEATLGGSFILPLLQKNRYDPFSAPIVFQGSAVVVRFGIYIESMSNFQTSTMDYDMDIFLMMAWRDVRLVNPYEKAILVKEEDILEKIWRPDPFFANAKEASFHEVTFLNFLMRIYNDGLVLYETRIKLKPSCNLVLCKYPHDKQTCELRIKSFSYPLKTVRFEWFSNKNDAIDKNPDVTLPELYIHRYESTYCEKTRKSGHFSCLKAIFRLKRDVGFYIAQTYIPTSLALMFSWVGVWLPEEFMEGRIGVAITVLLTLSTESAGAREHLPSVSYMKAIDLWFGFITAFVFITLLQTLIVIALDKRAKQMRKSAAKKKSELTEQSRELMLARAERYHKRGRYLDNFCRLFYPLGFLIFLIAYYFVFTEGRQNDCVVTGRQT
ncbi:unnamed protein product [Litomosoides sigmodontis]|uniref:Neurotransmitter-gated ion-channel ligand-binding domain-containing protein n=1 Tax=Litomosoides sigmodontis TaxID=42156 RepID=A0A3P6UCC3_LITSI|nr:unnamed protein product [Litomosoides sigmodontis]